MDSFFFLVCSAETSALKDPYKIEYHRPQPYINMKVIIIVSNKNVFPIIRVIYFYYWS